MRERGGGEREEREEGGRVGTGERRNGGEEVEKERRGKNLWVREYTVEYNTDIIWTTAACLEYRGVRISKVSVKVL